MVEIRPGERFEEMALNLFGLAQDGKASAKGMPNLVQAAIFAREFSDVLYFTRPPLWAQRLLFGALAASARVLGYRGSYPKYAEAPAPESSSGVGEGSRRRRGCWRGRSLWRPLCCWRPFRCSRDTPHSDPYSMFDLCPVRLHPG